MIGRYEQFTISISSAYQFLQKVEHNEMERYGLRGAYAQYLLAIYRNPEGITAAELAERCERDKAAVSRAVADMELQGFVRRELKNERGYRAKLMLTEEGREAAEYISRRCQLAVELAGQGVSDQDRAIMYATLERIAGNLQRISEDGILDDGAK